MLPAQYFFQFYWKYECFVSIFVRHILTVKLKAVPLLPKISPAQNFISNIDLAVIAQTQTATF